MLIPEWGMGSRPVEQTLLVPFGGGIASLFVRRGQSLRHLC